MFRSCTKINTCQKLTQDNAGTGLLGRPCRTPVRSSNGSARQRGDGRLFVRDLFEVGEVDLERVSERFGPTHRRPSAPAIGWLVRAGRAGQDDPYKGSDLPTRSEKRSIPLTADQPGVELDAVSLIRLNRDYGGPMLLPQNSVRGVRVTRTDSRYTTVVIVELP